MIVKDNFINAGSNSCAIYVNASKTIDISSNVINCTQVDTLTSEVCIVESDNVTVNDNMIISNMISLNASDVVGLEDMLHAIYLKSLKTVLFDGNLVDISGLEYIHGIFISSEDFTVSNNNITVKSNGNYAKAIDIGGFSAGSVEYNNITVEAPLTAYAVSSNMSNVSYAGNIIYSNADNAVAIDSNSSNTVIVNNTIISTESYNAKDVIIINSKANISGNFIESSSIAIDSTSSEIIIDNNTILCDVNSSVEFSAAIVLEAANGNINNNEINYTSSSNQAFGVSVHNVNDLIIANNKMNIKIPSLELYDELGNFDPKSAGLRIYESSNIILNNKNLFNVSYSEVNGFQDSINGVLVINSEHIAVNDTDIIVNGYSYAYAITLTGEDINVTESNIYSQCDNNYASGILLQDYGTYDILDNYIFVSAPNVVQAVKSDNYGDNLNSVYRQNIINASSSIIYAAYLSGSLDEFSQNEIYADGDLAIGIASSSDNASISSNSIEVKGTGLSNVSYPDSIKPETVGVKIIWGDTLITENHIRTNGKYAVNLTNTAATVAYNYLQAVSLFGDNSVYYIGAASVYNNTPNYDAFITAENVVMYYRNGTRFTATLQNINGTAIANEVITLKLNGVSYNRTTDENGSVSMAINLKAGNYIISASFTPGENYSEVSNSFDITVLSTVEGEDIIKIYKNDTQYVATFVDGEGNPLANGTDVTFNINGVFYTRQINGSDGQAMLNINLVPGEYIITATNPFNGEMYSNNITILSPIRDNLDIVKYFKNDTQFVDTIYAGNGSVAGEGENVTFNINGVFYTRQTNASGHVKLNINLQPGEYIITTIYNDCMVSNNIKVLNILFGDDLVKEYGGPDQFKALLVDGQGNPYPDQNVTFNVQGALYTKTTDSEGYASLNIGSKTAVGIYVVTSSFNGTTISNNITIIESDFS